MSHFLDKLPPETIVTGLVLLILREVFGFVSKVLRLKRNGSGKGCEQALGKISDNIQAQTKHMGALTQQVNISTIEMKGAMSELKQGIGNLKDHVVRH